MAADQTIIFNDNKTPGEVTSKREDDDLFLCESIATAPVDQRVQNDEPSMITPTNKLLTMQADSLHQTNYTLPHQRES